MREFGPEENKAINDVVQSYKFDKIPVMVLTLLCDEIHTINDKQERPRRNPKTIKNTVYSRRKKLQEEENPEKHESFNESKPTSEKKVSVGLCESIKQIKDCFQDLKTEIHALKTEVDRLQKVEEENLELKSKLRELRDIRQAVEQYQKRL
jgi:hypothetical protein